MPDPGYTEGVESNPSMAPVAQPMRVLNPLIQKLWQHQTWGFFILVLVTGVIVLAPYTNYHGMIAPGDSGRDFYAFEQTLKGEVPYQDYWWVYGPLMPYYYAMVMSLLGVTMGSVLVGKILLQLVAGLLLYLGLRFVIHPAFAYLASGWFLVFYEDFFFTHNHVAGTLLILGCARCLLGYVKETRMRYLWWGLAFALILAFVKVNFGFVALTALILSTFIIDRVRRQDPADSKKIFYGLAFLGLPVFIIGAYWLITRGLTIYEIRQCLPYLAVDHPYNISLGEALRILVQGTWDGVTSNWVSMAFGLLLSGSVIRTLFLFVLRKLPSSTEKTIGLSLIALSIFYIGNLHEFMSSGVWYRTVWSQPLGMMISFIVIHTAVSDWPRRWHTGMWILIVCFMSWGFYSKAAMVGEVKTADHYLSHPRARVYLTNSDRWIETVEKTTDFLMTNLEEDELFFALPYDPLYYYLTDKDSPTRQIIFFDHINIPEEQERTIISELRSHRVRYVLVSSRQNSSEVGLGVLGQTYCPLIAQYIRENFVPVAQFGDWENPPGWAWNHGTLLLEKRNEDQRAKTDEGPSRRLQPG